MPKLTLNADAKVINRAKRLAQEHGISVSAMFARYIQSMRHAAEGDTGRLGPLTRKATGLVKLPGGKTDRQLIESALAQRYGK